MAKRWMSQKMNRGRTVGFEPAEHDMFTSYTFPEGKRRFTPAETPASRKAKEEKERARIVPRVWERPAHWDRLDRAWNGYQAALTKPARLFRNGVEVK